MRWRFVSSMALVTLAVASSLAACGDDDTDTPSGSESDADQTPPSSLPVDQVLTFDVPSRNHTDRFVDYPQTPPVGGDHAAAWQNCGFYDAPIFSEAGVHSMEHGAVWITFRPNLPADQVDQIRSLAEQPYVLASPWEDNTLPAPIVFSAWGAQVAVDTLPSTVADEFLTTYREAASSPEPGAPCTGGIDETR